MYIIGFGELFIKGQNRNFFESTLKNSIKKALKLQDNQLINLHNRYLALADDAKSLKYVFGISFYAKATETGFNKISETALSLIKNQKAKTFRVNARRLTKEYKPSQDINIEVGSYILKHKPKLKVNLDKPEITVNIEIIKGKAYLYTDAEKGLQGLPLSTSCPIYLDFRNEKTGTVSGFLLMKRGCNLILEKSLPILNKFNFNNNIKITSQKQNQMFIASDLTLSKIPKNKQETVFYPLAGFNDKEINNLYNMIKGL